MRANVTKIWKRNWDKDGEERGRIFNIDRLLLYIIHTENIGHRPYILVHTY